MSLNTPLSKVRGLGSARNGTQHFIVQRITAIALVPLSVWLVYMLCCGLTLNYADARAIVAQPFNAVLLWFFVLAMFWHAMLGVQVVIEDYIHTSWLEMSAQLLNKFFAVAAMLIASLSIIRIVLGA